MYNIVKRSMTFNTMTDVEAIKEYELVMNDPLCSITKNVTTVLKETDFDADTGRPLRQVDNIIREIEWDEKVLL